MERRERERWREGGKEREMLELTGPGSRVSGLGSVALPDWIRHPPVESSLLDTHTQTHILTAECR